MSPGFFSTRQKMAEEYAADAPALFVSVTFKNLLY
jgi:hypothetical protein